MLVFLVLWQLACEDSPPRRFIFGTPLLILGKLRAGLADGTLLHHTAITGEEALGGFLLGMATGSLCGFVLLATPRTARLARPYIFLVGSIPVFAIAPMMIIWFGVGLKMKIALAFFATFPVALANAYQGGSGIDPMLKRLFAIYGTTGQTFTKLILPSALDWVLNGMRMCINLALLGAFIGEFIAADEGLGYMMVKAGGLYDVPLVLAGVVCFVVLAALFNSAIMLIDRKRRSLIGWLSVPKAVRQG